MKIRKLDKLGHVGYAVGKDGSVWCRLSRGGGKYHKGLDGIKKNPWRRRKLIANKDGYLSVGMCGRLITVASLILRAFVGPRPEGAVVRHFPDRNVTNNRLENLSWATQKENLADRKVHGTLNVGDKVHNSVLDAEKVRDIRNMWSSGAFNKSQIARHFGVSHPTIRHVLSGRTWNHIT